MTFQPPPVMIAAHSHVRISRGGAEVTAYEMFRRLRDEPDFEAIFLACSHDPLYGRDGSPITQPFGADEYIYTSLDFDWFKFANRDRYYPKSLAALLKNKQLSILHFHHYALFGVETFWHVRRILPHGVIILTLHEYLAICHHKGQMVKTERHVLCDRASNTDCTRCFADLTPADFFRRKQYIFRFLALVDHFIAPSRFLADRYIAWGLPESKMTVIENVLPQRTVPEVAVRETGEQLIAGFFGQISELKGVGVLFGAAERLARAGIHDVSIEIHGDYGQSSWKDDFLQRLDASPPNIRFVGPYRNESVDRLMQQVDVVVVPSIWWENSPVVIQEALRNGRPVVCSDIGGMAEKVINGVDGFHFRTGSSEDLARILCQLATQRNRLRKMQQTLRHRQRLGDDAFTRHINLYRALQGADSIGSRSAR
jgi:glycosyltransferase involved in cell wall biosynthesis